MGHDSSYKRLFSHVEVVESCVSGFLPRWLVKELDFSTLQALPTVHVDHRHRERRNDLLWRIEWKDGGVCYVVLMFEFQSTGDHRMVVRLWNYVGCVWEEILNNEKGLEKATLPTVVPIVIYNGLHPWNAAQDIDDYLRARPRGIQRINGHFRYFVLDVRRLPGRKLEKDLGLSSWIFRLERTSSSQELVKLLRVLERSLRSERYSQLRRDFVQWIVSILLPQRGYEETADRNLLEEVDDMGQVVDYIENWRAQDQAEARAKGLAEGEAKGRAEGEARGMAKGEAKGEISMLKRLLGGGLSIDSIAQALGMSVVEVRKLAAGDNNA